VDDEHLLGIGYINIACSVLERKFHSLILITAGWTQQVGELEIADIGNVSASSLLIDQLKLNLDRHNDQLLLEQGIKTAALFDNIFADRNDIVRSFFIIDPTRDLDRRINRSAKQRHGEPEIKTIAWSKQDINELCIEISDCYESIDDLICKIWLRRKFVDEEFGKNSRSYQQRVHDGQEPSFDMERLLRHLKGRSQRRLNPPQGPRRLQSPG
jgi:hypothetical protein